MATGFAGEFKKLCRAEGKDIYTTMRENKAVFAEQTARPLKSFFYRYMEALDKSTFTNYLNSLQL